MAFNVNGVRNFIEITPSPFELVFINTNSDLNLIDEVTLLSQEVLTIPRINVTPTYATNQSTIVKSLTLPLVTVESASDSVFNTVVVLTGSNIVGKYQFNTKIEIGPQKPSLIQLGLVNMDFA